MPQIEATLLATSREHLRVDDAYGDYLIVVNAAVFTEGDQLALADEDGIVRLYSTEAGHFEELTTGSVAADPTEDWTVTHLAWSRSREALACRATLRKGEGPDDLRPLESWLITLDARTLAVLRRWPLEDADWHNQMSWAEHGELVALLRGSVVLRRQGDAAVTGGIPRGTDPYGRDQTNQIALTADGSRLAVALGDGSVQVWSITQGVPGEMLLIPPPEPPAPDAPPWMTLRLVQDLVWSPSSDQLAWSERGGGVWRWQQWSADLAQERQAIALEHPESSFRFDELVERRRALSMEHLAWSPDGAWLAGLDNFGILYFWHPATSPAYTRIPLEEGADRLWRPAWGPQGLLVTPGLGGQARLWQITVHE